MNTLDETKDLIREAETCFDSNNTELLARMIAQYKKIAREFKVSDILWHNFDYFRELGNACAELNRNRIRIFGKGA